MGKSNIKELQQLIIEHLILLEEKIEHYFPSLTTSADWVVLPFDFTDNVNELDLTNNEKNELIDMSSSSTIRILFNSKKNNMDSFWALSETSYKCIFSTFFTLHYNTLSSPRSNMNDESLHAKREKS
ncbi:hypothetical protein QTP88_008942 [Uroleucon formosanum]